MEHTMKLYETPFNSIKWGKKTVEVRLNDEKRRKLQIGDLITFTKIPSHDETVTVEIIELNRYPTFKQMYEAIPASDFDAVGGSITEMVKNTYDIYSPVQEKEWGTLAIRIKLVR